MTPRTPARSFDAWAGDYDRYRPTYPDELFGLIGERLELPDGPEVADLGAGTGRASLAMARLGWRVTAVEPGIAMLEQLRAAAGREGLRIETREASAEATGLPAASVDVATAGQAFHWFDAPRAIAEMRRIVRPRGGVALFWNVRDPDRSAFVAAYHRLLEAYPAGDDAARYLRAGVASGRDATRRAVAAVEGFDGLELVELQHAVEMSADDFVGMAFTASYVRLMPADRQARFRTELTGLLERHGLSDGRFSLPYHIDCWITRRSDQ